MFSRLFPLLFVFPLTAADVTTVFERVENHDFHPVREGFTYDRQFDKATLAIHAIKSDQPATDALAEAWRTLDPATSATAKVGEPAPDFTLSDTDGQTWKLSDFRRKKAIALVDKQGTLRFLYQGTYWGDRPTIHEVLEMNESCRETVDRLDTTSGQPSPVKPRPARHDSLV